MKDKKKRNKICTILYTISSILFMISGITFLVNKGFSEWTWITGVALGITFGCLAFMYFKKFKEEK